MRESKRIQAAIIRGGTSKGVFLLESELPGDADRRDEVILAIFGSPDRRQIDGLGGADPLTSKVVIIAPSERSDVDVDYTVGYVGIDTAIVDYDGNCGNLSLAVGPYAVDEGLVSSTEPVTRVRIFNTNTKKVIEAEVPVRGGKAQTEGTSVMDGVPGSGAEIVVNFVNSAGSKTGKLLPTGNAIDEIELADGRRLRCSLVDVANPAVFFQAAEIGVDNRAFFEGTTTDPQLLAIMEEVRVQAGVRMGLATASEQVGPAVPKVALVAEAQDYQTLTGRTIAGSQCDLLAQTKALTKIHKAYAVTGGICLGAAALIEGTVVHEVARPSVRHAGVVRIGHPSGVSNVMVAVGEATSGGLDVTKAAVTGTARRIMDGYVYVSQRLFEAAS